MTKLSNEARTYFLMEIQNVADHPQLKLPNPTLAKALAELEETPADIVAGWCGRDDWPGRTSKQFLSEAEDEEIADTLIEEVRQLVGEEGGDCRLADLLLQQMALAGAQGSGREL